MINYPLKYFKELHKTNLNLELNFYIRMGKTITNSKKYIMSTGKCWAFIT